MSLADYSLETLTNTDNYKQMTPEDQGLFLSDYQQQVLEKARTDPRINVGNEPVNDLQESPEDYNPLNVLTGSSQTTQDSQSTETKTNYKSFTDHFNGRINEEKNHVFIRKASQMIDQDFSTTEDRERAADQIGHYKEAWEMYDPDVLPTAKKVRELLGSTGFSGTKEAKGFLRDSRGNDLAGFDISYNSASAPEYAIIDIHNKGEFDNQRQTNDIVQFPQSFNATDYQLKALEQEAREAFQKAYGVTGTIMKGLEGAFPFKYDGETIDPVALIDSRIGTKEAALDYQVKMNQLNVARQRIKDNDQEFIYEFNQQGASSYIKDYIKSQVESGNERYAEIGQTWGEAAINAIYNTPPRMAYNAAGAVLSGLEGLANYGRDQAQQRVVQDQDGTPVIDVGASALASAYGDAANLISGARASLSKKTQELSKQQGFSQLEITNPTTAEWTEFGTQAVLSGAESAAVGVLGKLGLFGRLGASGHGATATSAYGYLQGAGNKTLSLSALEQEKRIQGDVEGANYIRDNQGKLSFIAGISEFLSERFSSGELIMKPLGNRGVRGYGGAIAGEGIEEGWNELAQINADYYSGISTAEEAADKVAEAWKAGLGGMVGAFGPVTLRQAINPREQQQNAVEERVTQDVVREGTRSVLEAIDQRAKEEGISRREAAPLTLDEIREAAIEASKKHIQQTEGQQGDQPQQSARMQARKKPVSNKKKRKSSSESARTPQEQAYWEANPDFVESGLIDAGEQEGDAFSGIRTQDSQSTETQEDVRFEADPAAVESGLTEFEEGEGNAFASVRFNSTTRGEPQEPQLLGLNEGDSQLTETADSDGVYVLERTEDNPVEETPPFPQSDIPQENIERMRTYLTSLTNPQRTGAFDKQLADLVSELGPEGVNDVAIFLAAQFEDRITGTTPTDTTVYRVTEQPLSEENEPNPELNRTINPDQIALVSDQFGKTRLISADQFVQGINNGDIDPNNSLFYISVSLRENWSQAPEDSRGPSKGKLSDPVFIEAFGNAVAQIPSQNLVNYSPSDLTTPYNVSTDRRGNTVEQWTQSKTLEMQLFQDTPYGIETQTLGGQQLGDTENDPSLASTPDILSELGITIPEEGRYLTDGEKTRIADYLDQKHGQGKWLLKPMYGGQGKGRIEDRFQFMGVNLPIRPEEFYLAQPKVGVRENVFRADVRVGENGKPQIVPLAISDQHRGQNQSPYLSKKIRDQMADVVSIMEKGGAITPNTNFGVDFILDDSGNLRVLELNPTDSWGGSGWGEYYQQMGRGNVASLTGTNQIEGIAAYAALVRARGQEVLASQLTENALRGQDISPEVQEQELKNRVMFNHDKPAPEVGYKFNGTQKDIDGNPAYDLYTIYQKDHPFYGSTVMVPFGSTADQVEDAIEKKRGQNIRYSQNASTSSSDVAGRDTTNLTTDEYTYDDFVSDLNSGGVVEIDWSLHALTKSRNPIIAATAKILLRAPKELTKGTVLFRNKDVDYSAYDPHARGRGGNITLGNNISEWVTLHEIIHAFTQNIIPYELSKYVLPNATGKQYREGLEKYLKEGKNKLLKRVIRNYIQTVEALGYSDRIFGDQRLQPGQATDNPVEYGLRDLGEFCSEVTSRPELINAINQIQNPAQLSLTKRLIRSILEFFNVSVFEGYSPFYNQVYADTLSFINQGIVAQNEYQKSFLRAKAQNLKHAITNLIDRSDEIASQENLTTGDARNLSQLNHRKARSSPDIKNTTVYSRSISRDDLLDLSEFRTLPSDTAIDITQDIDPKKLTGDGVKVVWNTQDRNGGFIAVIDDGSLSPSDKAILSDRGFDIINDVDLTQLSLFSAVNDGGKKASRKRKLPPRIRTVSGEDINTRYTTPDQNTQLTIVENQLTNKTISSDDALKTVREIRQSAEAREVSDLQSQYPEAFENKKIDSVADARLAVFDYLHDNSADPASQSTENKAKVRAQRVSQLAETFDELGNADLSGFDNIPQDDVKALVKRAINFIVANYNPELASNRDLFAWNKILQTFIDSKGSDISPFARIIADLVKEDKLTILNKAKDDEVFGRSRKDKEMNIFGMPISNVRRGAMSRSKTGTALSDVSSELDAIFNTKRLKDAFIKIISDFHTGLNHFDVMRDRLLKEFSDGVNAIEDRYAKTRGKSTRLDDSIIQIAKRVTQWEIGSKLTPLEQIQRNIADERMSYSRKTGDTVNQRNTEEGAIDQTAFNRLLLSDLDDQIANGTITDEQQAVDFIENNLDPYHLEILHEIRRPGNDYWNALNVVNNLAVGMKGVQRRALRPWANYAKRSQRPLRTQSYTSSWGEAGFTSGLSIFQPREGLGSDRNNVFNSNWRTDAEIQLTETSYELNTGIPRVHLFNTFEGNDIVNILDQGIPSAPRTDRIRAQLGNMHAFSRNQELKIESVYGAVLGVTAWGMAQNLASLRQSLNQLGPSIIYWLKNPVLTTRAALSRGTPGTRSAQNDFMKQHSPYLYNRMRHFDQLAERATEKARQNFKNTGLPQLDTLYNRLSKSIGKTLSLRGDRLRTLAGMPLRITNGYTEVFSARNVFMTLYAQQLQQRGVIANAGDLFTLPYVPFDKEALTAAEIEAERYILSPLNPAYRGDMWQRNSIGKELIRQGFFSLARTGIQQSIKSGTAARDLTDALREYAHTKSPQSLSFAREKANDLLAQQMQLSVYYGIRILQQSMTLSIGGVASFIAASFLNGDDDKEEWIKRLRILRAMYSDDQSTGLGQQFSTDLIYQIMPFGFMQNNVSRGIVEGFLKLGQLAQFDTETLKNEKDDLEEAKRILKQKMASYDKLGQSNKAEELEIPLEYVETSLEWTRRRIEELDKRFTQATDRLLRNVFPISQELMEKARKAEETFIPKGDQEYRQAREEAKKNNSWWMISEYLGIDNPMRKSARDVIREKTYKEYQEREAAEKRYNRGIDYLDEGYETPDIEVPDQFRQGVLSDPTSSQLTE